MSAAGGVPYPDAERLELVEDLFGRRVADPYRWLEAGDDPAVAGWLHEQAALYAAHLARWPARSVLRQRLEALTPGAVGLPHVRGARAFFPRRLKGQDQAVWVMAELEVGADGLAEPEAGSEQVVLDPAVLSDDGTVVVQWAQPSVDGRHLAYAVDEGGREEDVVRILEVDGGGQVGPPLELGRGGDLAWLPDGGGLFVVATLPGLPEDERQFHRRVWRLRLGEGLEGADPVFGEGRSKTTYYGLGTSADGRWLTVSCSLGTAPRNDLYLCDLHTADLGFVAVSEGADAQTGGGVAADGRLWLWTSLDAPRGRLVTADPATPTAWTEMVPEGADVLDDWALTDGGLYVAWRRHVASAVTVHDRATGRQTGDVALPGLGSVSMIGRPGGVGADLWLAYTDDLTPGHVLHHGNGTTEVWAAAPGAPPGDDGLEVVRTFVSSPDGTRVPLFVSRRRGQPLDGTAPTILYGYGGFQVSLTPAYSSGARAWVEAGGVYATACLRGGGEYGEEWHRDGMRDVKQHVFDDFLACARWLVASGHTSPEHLAIAGGSNGGLLVGAALTQAPDAFRAVHCSAPLLDMVRYERFGLGITWNDEYGTAEDPEELGWLLSYSPVHHVAVGTTYPAVLFTTFGGDTRVDPLHARKLCAALQHATAADPEERPVLLRHEEAVGHGMRTVSRSLDERAEVLAFLASQVGWPAAAADPSTPA